MLKLKGLFFIAIGLFFFIACQTSEKRLPILGNPTLVGKDSVYPVIADFSFVNQNGEEVNNQTFDNHIYIADFIFLSCPSICPKMTHEMHQVYLAFANNEKVKFISHSIDPERDSLSRLKAYAENLGVVANKWHFVRTSQDSVLQIAEKSYFSTAYPDSTAPGGFTHSGGLLLVDKNRHIRGVYNGTNPQETKRLIEDIQTLLKEQFKP